MVGFFFLVLFGVDCLCFFLGVVMVVGARFLFCVLEVEDFWTFMKKFSGGSGGYGCKLRREEADE